MQADPKLPGMHLIWSDSAMCEFFNRHVMPAIWPGNKVASVNQQNMNWKPGKRCVALYELNLEDGAPLPKLRVSFMLDRNSRKLADSYEKHYGDGPKLANGTPLPALHLPDLGCVIETFPHDWALTTLPQAVSLDRVLPIVASTQKPISEPGELDCEISVLRYKPHKRCVLSYKVRRPGVAGSEEIIAKVYGRSKKAVAAYSTHQKLEAAAASAEGLVIPRPLAFEETLNLVLMERIHGPSMKDCLHDGADPDLMARTAAVSLATLHSLKFDGRSVGTMHEKLEHMDSSVDRVRQISPEMASRIEAMFSRIRKLMERFKSPRLRLIHGAFRPAHMVVGTGEVALIDLDGAGLGDPAIDVGDFMAKERTKGQLMEIGGAASRTDSFLNEYQARSGADAALAERAHLYCAMIFIGRSVRECLHAPTHCPDANEFSRSNVFLKEAAECLNLLG
jgi:aminoglycoside phosphotransferase (APT) family kinase protein